jgi:hypothetical protein
MFMHDLGGKLGLKDECSDPSTMTFAVLWMTQIRKQRWKAALRENQENSAKEFGVLNIAQLSLGSGLTF